MIFPPDITSAAEKIIALYTAKKLKIVTAESCTGGLIAAALTSVAGASVVVERGFVSYSNDAKIDVLGVPPELLQQHGAVSAPVAEEMALGALEFSHANVAVSVTGIAGPSGESHEKPVGLVFLGLATRQKTAVHYQCFFSGTREEIQLQSVAEALKLLSMVEES